MEQYVVYVHKRKSWDGRIKKKIRSLPCAMRFALGKHVKHTAKILICRVFSWAHGELNGPPLAVTARASLP